MKLRFIGFCLLFTLVQTSYGQTLPRKGSLGIAMYQQIPDTLKQRLGFTQGVIVEKVFPGTTAAINGLQTEDIITNFNGQEIRNNGELIAALKNIRDGDIVNIGLKRKKIDQIVSAKVIGRPLEQDPKANVEYGSFPYKGGLVRTILKSPKDKPIKGTIYFLQGIPCYSMDNMQPLDKTKQALDALVANGYAVYRMEKGDMGDNLNCPPCSSMGYNEELAMYDAGYQNLLKLPNVNKEKLFIFGHSMGGTTAPLLAEKYQPLGVVVYGTLFKPWLEYLLDVNLYQNNMRGGDFAALRTEIEEAKPHLYRYFYQNEKIEDLVKDEKVLAAFEKLLGYNVNNNQTFAGRNLLTLKELNDQNVAKAWANYNGHSLGIYGECDIAAISSEDTEELITVVNQTKPGHGTFWLAPKSSHSFEELGTMEEFLKLSAVPGLAEQKGQMAFNQKIFDYVGSWMDSTLNKKMFKPKQRHFVDVSNQLPDMGASKPTMDVKAADIDNDGDLDIILANEFEANSILENDGKGNFKDASKLRLPQVVHDSEDVVAHDFDKDGDIDLIFCSEDDLIHEYYLNDGKGMFREAAFKFENSEANAVINGDVNGDGWDDVIFGNNGQNIVYINLKNGQFGLDKSRLPLKTKVTQDLLLVDLDKDGDLDLIEGNEDGNKLYFNDGKGFFKEIDPSKFPQNDKMETRKIAVSDVDIDGDLDILFANVNFKQNKDPQNRIYINNKGKFTDETSLRLPSDSDHTIDAIFTDLDDDGDHDILCANVFGAPIKAYLNNGKGIFNVDEDNIMREVTIDALGVISADLDGDQLKDLYICDRFNPMVGNKDIFLKKVKLK